MVTALIVIGVIAFLVFDFWLLRKVMGGHKSADDYASIRVPGETTIAVPGGKVKLTYQESKRSGGDEHEIYFDTPSALEVKVVSASGGELEIKGPGFKGMGSSKSTGGFGSPFSRAVIGTVEVPGADNLTITAGPELPDAVEPTILVGK